MSDDFKAYQKQLVKNASVLADELTRLGYRIVSGGTDNHLMLVDLRPKNATGKEVQIACDKAGITLNKNMIPFDPEKPMITSGVRIGTPAVTDRHASGTDGAVLRTSGAAQPHRSGRLFAFRKMLYHTM